MKCPKCNYEWKTKTELMYVSCPSCRLKVKNEENTTQSEDSTQKGEKHV